MSSFSKKKKEEVQIYPFEHVIWENMTVAMKKANHALGSTKHKSNILPHMHV